jgi:hypothetical protein
MKPGLRLASFVALLLMAVVTLALAATVVLDFPENNPEQEHSQWCWAGSSQAILAYYGTNVSQCAIANYASGYPGVAGRPDCCTPSGYSDGDNVSAGCNYWNYMWGSSSWGVSGGSLQGILSHWGVSSTTVNRNLSQAEVIADISARRPAVMRFGWKCSNGLPNCGGHFLDLYGQEQDAAYLDYWDPWPGNGATRSLYTWVVDATGHNWTDSLRITTNLPSYLSINDVSVAEGQSGTTNATFTVSLSAASQSTVTVGYQTSNVTATALGGTNAAGISIPSSGAATPYPSGIAVPPGLGCLQKVRATLTGFSHTWPSDVDVLLVGPSGQSVVLMSDVGSSTDAVDVNFVFDDTGPALGTGTLASGTYRPTDVTPGDTWTSPAPAGPYGTALSVFNGTDPAGIWSLYVVDDASGDSGTFSGGWSLGLTTAAQTGDYMPATGTLSIPPGATSGTVTVTVFGDIAVEPSETFFVTLFNASNAIITDGLGVGTIVNDDETRARGDFTGDLKSDVLWRHGTQGDLWLWPMDGTARTAETHVRTVGDTNWEIRGQGDMTGDGKADLLWRNKTTGQIYLWPMNGSTPLSETYVATVDPAYDIVGTDDFDGDGKSDILWRHTTLGDVWIWLMDGAVPQSEVHVDTVDPGYAVKGVGDLDGNGKADIVWHGAAGDVWVWLMNGTTRLSQTWVATVPDTGYQIVGVADHTGDGKADILWHHATRGEVWIWTMNGAVRTAETWVGTVSDTGYQIVGTGDYNGDTKADILWHHTTRGEVWVWLMDGTTKVSETWVATVSDVGYQIVR